MELFNLLETGIPVFGITYDVSLNWIGNLIRSLCGAVGVVGVGIILFSLILKLITLPFDIYQRISMRKQNLQMEANKEKMEKHSTAAAKMITWDIRSATAYGQTYFSAQ